MPKKSDRKIGRHLGPINENGIEVGYLTTDTGSGLVRAIFYDDIPEDLNKQSFSLNAESAKDLKRKELEKQLAELKGEEPVSEEV